MSGRGPDRFYIDDKATVREAIGCIDRNASGISLVVDSDGRLLATVTDGDIRRFVLDGLSLDLPVQELIARKAGSKYPEPVTAPAGTSSGDLVKLMTEAKIRHIPLVNRSGQVTDLVVLDDLIPMAELPVQAVVMAGGYGTRLHPLTEDTPKPLLPIGDRPLMEHVIDQLRSSGIHNVNITTHYLAEMISEHFGTGESFGVRISYIPEEQPLGTAGALSLLENTDEPLLVVNGDIITRVDYRDMLKFHREEQAQMTVGVRQYEFEVPYGVIESDGIRVVGLREKPGYRLLVNAGIYLMEPGVRSLVPLGRRLDMTQLIEVLIAGGGKVACFPVVEYWLDAGQHETYKQAQEDMSTMDGQE